LVAKVDPENVASRRILRGVGRWGEVLREWYERKGDSGKKRDIECWYIDRPGWEAESETMVATEV
jgi:RimJ/RimL family protein N-acetyltransferase